MNRLLASVPHKQTDMSSTHVSHYDGPSPPPIRMYNARSIARDLAVAQEQSQPLMLITHDMLEVSQSSTNRRRGASGSVKYGSMRLGSMRVPVAIKYPLDQTHMCDKTFLAECRALSQIPRSPYTVNAYGVSVMPPGIVMHRYKMTLFEFMRRTFIWEDSDSDSGYAYHVCAILAHAARGLTHMHANGVLHNDLHTGNVLIDVNESARRVNAVVADFGRATISSDQEHKIVLQAPWLAAKTLVEIVMSKESDVFSLGVLVMSVMIGESGEKRTIHELVGRDGVATLVPSARLAKSMGNGKTFERLHKKLCNIIASCTNPVPKSRPTAERVKDMLEFTVTWLERVAC